MLYELRSSTLLATVEAHAGPIWSLDLRPDGKGFITGSGDKSVKFWNFTKKVLPFDEAVQPGSDTKTVHLSVAHTKTMKMSDDVLGVRYSPDGKFLAVATLDSTVKVFFQDTLKFFLSLYGHKVGTSTFITSSLHCSPTSLMVTIALIKITAARLGHGHLL